LPFKASQPGKKLSRPHLNGKKLEIVAHAYHPSNCGKHNRKIKVQAILGKKARYNFPKN
jgi:hypothetical protein